VAAVVPSAGAGAADDDDDGSDAESLSARRGVTPPPATHACALLRREKVGFVFQAFHVLPHLDVAQNVALPLLLLGTPDAGRVQTMLDDVGLGALGQRLPQQLSGGQLQRVAIARALVHRPRLILADEPTGNLDPGTATLVMDALISQCRMHGASLVLVTHSQAATHRADRVLQLTSDGLSIGRVSVQAPH
jgi:putative ABC transport system ATP-binding protein